MVRSPVNSGVGAHNPCRTLDYVGQSRPSPTRGAADVNPCP